MTIADDMLDAGGDVALVQRLMWHSAVSTTVGYDRRPAEATRRAAGLVGVPYSTRKNHFRYSVCNFISARGIRNRNTAASGS